MHLYEPEIFIALILENLCKESNFMLILNVCLDTINNRCCPFDDEGLETIFLIKVGVHVLLEGLLAHFRLRTLLVKLLLLNVHVLNGIF